MPSRLVISLVLLTLLSACSVLRSGSDLIEKQLELRIVTISADKAKKSGLPADSVVVPATVQLRNPGPHGVVVTEAHVESMIRRAQFYEPQAKVWWNIPLIKSGIMVQPDESPMNIPANSTVTKDLWILAGERALLPVNEHLIPDGAIYPWPEELLYRICDVLPSPEGYQVKVQGTGRAKVN